SDDYSLTAAILAICTLIAVDVGLSIIKLRSSRVRRWLDGTPTLLVDHGRPLRARLAKAPAGGRHPAGGARGPRPAAHGADQVCDPGGQREDFHHPLFVTRRARPTGHQLLARSALRSARTSSWLRSTPSYWRCTRARISAGRSFSRAR